MACVCKCFSHLLCLFISHFKNIPAYNCLLDTLSCRIEIYNQCKMEMRVSSNIIQGRISIESFCLPSTPQQVCPLMQCYSLYFSTCACHRSKETFRVLNVPISKCEIFCTEVQRESMEIRKRPLFYYSHLPGSQSKANYSLAPFYYIPSCCSCK